MAFGRLRVKARCKPGRGSVDASAVIDAMINTWDDLREAIDGLEDAEKDQLREHFNSLLADEDDTLGDILFGSVDDFKQCVDVLQDDVKTDYTNELIAQEVIDKDELEASVGE